MNSKKIIFKKLIKISVVWPTKESKNKMTKKQQTLTLRDNEIKNEISPKKGLNKTKQKKQESNWSTK